MVIRKEWMEEWLLLFGIEGKVVDTLEFLNKDIVMDGERQVRVITAVETDREEVVVFKLVHETMFYRELIESQLLFSQSLREAGVNTTYQYKADRGYVQELILDGMEFCLTCEGFIGSRPSELTADLEYAVGKELGKMHRISEERQLKVGCSRLYHEVMNKSSYQVAWRDVPHDWVDPEWLDEMTEIHDALMEEIQAEFDKLPKAAVQADVYGVNNVAITEDGNIAIFDYNLAADEVLVGDFLVSWYRTIADINMYAFINEENAGLMWEAFSTGYLESRPLSLREYEIGRKLSAVLGLVYLTKVAIVLEESEDVEAARECLRAGERLLKNPRWLEEK